MFDELRKILLVCAGHIQLMRGPEAAIAFIGFATTSEHDDWPYEEDDPQKVDLELFATPFNGVKWLLDFAYDYAFQIGRYRFYDEMADQRLISFREGGVPAYDTHGHQNPYYAEDSKCRYIADMAQARYHLEHYDASPSIRELSLLSGMSEAAVRNSLSSEGIKMEDFGGKRRISNEAARRWLYGRRGFIPTKEDDHKEFWKAYSRGLLERDLSTGLKQILEQFPTEEDPEGLTVEDLGERAAVPTEVILDMLNWKFPLDVDILRRVGEALETDVPFFVSRAIESALFREMSSK
jgi:hypothetical protein